MSQFDKIKKVSGHQPVYLPWLGLFHKLYLSDVFVYMDTVQYLSGDWNNRNKIKTSQNSLMLSVPINKKKSKNLNLTNIKISNDNYNSKDFWQRIHWESIKINYKKSPFFDLYKKDFEEMYLEKKWDNLVDLCWYQFNLFRRYLGLENKKIIRMSEKEFSGYKDDLVLDHCIKLDCNAVIFGELGKNYVNLNKFNEKNILVYFQKYNHPVYNQRYKNFIPNLSIVDLLFNEGPENSKKIFLENNVTENELKNISKWFNYKECKNDEH